MRGRSKLVWAAWLFLIVIAIGFATLADMALPAEKAILKVLAFRDGRTPETLITAAQWITWIGDAAQRSVIIIAAALWLLWVKRPGAALAMATMPVLASATSSLLKEAFSRARPQVVPHLDQVNNLSFPSGHATNAAAAFLLIAFLLPGTSPRLRLIAAVLCAFLIGGSRIVLGVHWPSDVIGGWLLGLGFALVGLHLANRLETGRGFGL